MQKLHILKIGGNVLDNPDLLHKFLSDFAHLETHKILVHGGGKLTNELAAKLAIPQTIIDGRRLTDKTTLDLALMVYAGLTNKKVVVKLQALNCNAMGFSGADGNLIQSKRREHPEIDFGEVGDIETINSSWINHFLDMGISPVFCAISHDGKGNLLNVNADTIVTQLAIALSAHYKVELTYCFEKKGVLSDPEDDGSCLSKINPLKYKKLKEQQVISAGMIPKLDNAFQALQEGVQLVKICHAENIHNKGTKIEN